METKGVLPNGKHPYPELTQIAPDGFRTPHLAGWRAHMPREAPSARVGAEGGVMIEHTRWTPVLPALVVQTLDDDGEGLTNGC
jgi:hypothetical protein